MTGTSDQPGRVEYLYVPVPAPHYPQVLALLAQLGAGEPTAAAPLEARALAAVPTTGLAWTAEELTRLAGTQLVGIRTVCAALDVLAETPGTWVSTTTLTERVGVTRESLRGALSAFTRHLNKHYKGHPWPMLVDAGPNLGREYGTQSWYQISAAMADRWTATRAA